MSPEAHQPRRRIPLCCAHACGWLLCTFSLVAYPQLAGWHGALGLVAALPVALLWWRSRRTLLAPAVATIGALVALAWLWSLQPSNDRDWWPETSVLPTVTIDGDRMRIDGLRDFSWSGDGGGEVRWVSREYDLARLRELDLIVEPFMDSELAAHTMLSFGFGDERLIVSVEARKERGEEYGLIPGAFRQFELIYVFGSERDLLTLRAVGRRSRIQLFPVRVEPDFIRSLLVDLAAAANALHEQPRFYRTVRDNCTTTLLAHIDRQLDEPIGFGLDVLFPARAGRLLHALGYMRTELEYEQAHRHFQVDEQIRQHAGDPDLSRRIRARD